MRIKSFTGTSTSDAMNKVRQELGDEAIILATQNLPSGEAQVTAAIEQKEAQVAPISLKKDWAADWDSDWKNEASPKKAPRSKPDFGLKTERNNPQAPVTTPKPAASKTGPTIIKARKQEEIPVTVTPEVEILVQAMAYHGIPTLLAERICRTALAVETDDITLALAASLDRHFNYSPKFSRKNAPLMLIGPPGVGKTMTIAKMAASARLEGRKVHIITADNSRAGAVDQLKAFTDILGLKLWIAESPEQLTSIIAKPELQDNTHILIDTGGINSYDTEQVEALAKLIIAAKAEAVAVLAAGTDSAEMGDTAANFASIGARRLIITRLDTTRRYGGIFTAADNANLSFSYASVSPAVATGLHIINPVNLARLVLRDPTSTGISNEFDKASK